MKVSIASDHRGIHIKNRLVQTLTGAGLTVFDEGTDSERAVDYPDYAQHVAKKVSCGQADRGILICGTGIGMAITANKFGGVRAASCYDEVMVEMSRRHNNVNVLCLPGDMIGDRPIDELVMMWLQTEFDGGRHEVRINKITEIERTSGGMPQSPANESPANESPANESPANESPANESLANESPANESLKKE